MQSEHIEHAYPHTAYPQTAYLHTQLPDNAVYSLPSAAVSYPDRAISPPSPFVLLSSPPQTRPSLRDRNKFRMREARNSVTGTASAQTVKDYERQRARRRTNRQSANSPPALPFDSPHSPPSLRERNKLRMREARKSSTGTASIQIAKDYERQRARRRSDHQPDQSSPVASSSRLDAQSSPFPYQDPSASGLFASDEPHDNVQHVSFDVASPQERISLDDTDPCASSVFCSCTVVHGSSGTPFHMLPFDDMDASGLRIALASHRVARPPRLKLDALRLLASAHKCSDVCRGVLFRVTHSVADLKLSSADETRRRYELALHKSLESKFPARHSTSRLKEFIRHWLEVMSDERFKEVVCAVCSELVSSTLAQERNLTDSQLELLSNPDGRHHMNPDIFPTGYSRTQYRDALLDRRGLLPSDEASCLANVCNSCWRYISGDRLPPLSLANLNYIGLDCVPPHIRELFEIASPVELSMIQRYRPKCRFYKFSRKKGSALYGTSDVTSQRYSKGNVITFTNGNTNLLEVLPPSADALRETLAVIFVGPHLPAPEEVKLMTPLLARRFVVEPLLRWLKVNNPFYHDITISEENLKDMTRVDASGMPAMLNVELVTSEEVDAPSSSYVLDTASGSAPTDSTDMPIFSEGVVSPDIEAAPVRDLKLAAMRKFKQSGAIAIKHGDTPIQDFNNPNLFPCMYPHLFPWGMGAPDATGKSQKVYLEAHVRHLLNTADRQFQTDHSFLFVSVNILQKLAVYKGTKWRVRRSSQDRILRYLSSAEASACETLQKRSKGGERMVAETEGEQTILNLAKELKAVHIPIPGSESSKIGMRNQIRSMCHFLGMPTFFFTLNPSDVHHPLFCKLAGRGGSLDERIPSTLPSHHERAKLVASNPVAGAKFFHSMMTAFISVFLGGSSGDGIFGKVAGYYGTVEAQGRGSLHCHMFIWIDGGLSPNQLRQKMSHDPEFRDDMFGYLENTVHTCLPSNDRVVQVSEASYRHRGPDDDHPCTTRCPHPDDEDFEDEFAKTLEQLVYECHYHIHTATCWKGVARDAPKDDSTCRMRMNGETRASTQIDAETGSILLKRLHPYINQHNRIITACTRCNSDLKFIGSGAGAQALIHYATDYITKSNLPTHTVFAALQRVLETISSADSVDLTDPGQVEDRDQAECARRFLNKACNSLMAELEISGQQAALHLLQSGDTDRYTDRSFLSLYWASFNSWARRRELELYCSDPSNPERPVVFDDVSGAMRDDTSRGGEGCVVPEDEGEEVVLTLCDSNQVSFSSQVDDYMYRSPSLDNTPLYWFVSSVKMLKKGDEVERLGRASRDTARTSPRSALDPKHPLFATHLMALREKLLVPVILGPTLPRPDREDQYDDYCRAMLLLFCPWRDITDLKRRDETWTDAFQRLENTFDERSRDIMNNMRVLYECKDARDEYSRMRRAGTLCHDMIGEPQVLRSVASANSTEEPELTALDLLYEQMPDVAKDIELNSEGVSHEHSNPIISSEDMVARTAVGNAMRNDAFACAEPEDTIDLAELNSEQISARNKRYVKATAAFKKLGRQLEEGDGEQQVRIKISESGSSLKRKREDGESLRSRKRARKDDRSYMMSYVAKDLSNERDPDVLVQLILDKGLNREQTAAVGLVAQHHMNDESKPLIMLVTGGGGTGKSYVVHGIESYFGQIGRPGMLRKGGPTGCAAYLIDAETVHYMLRLHLDASKISSSLSDLQDEWAGVKYLIVDEVSMIGSIMLCKISERLCQIKGNSDPFGGLSLIFLGDIRQLPPVQDAVLWMSSDTDNIRIASAAQKKSGQQTAHGRGLWLLVDHVVNLSINHRQRSDPLYASLVERVGNGNATAEDVRTLNTRLISHCSLSPQFANAPLVTADKSIRDEWNNRMVVRYAKMTGQTLHSYVARDTLKNGKPPTRRGMLALRSLSTSISKDRMGSLPLVKGMKVMILTNVITTAGVVNGAEGTLDNIVYELNADNERVAVCAHVKLEGCTLEYEGLDPGVVPVFPNKTYFTVGKGEGRLGVHRSQLPLLPAYAFTDFKSQGRTMPFVILDLQSSYRSRESTYVMLSRAKELNQMAVLRPFLAKNVTRGLSAAVSNEMSRLGKIAVQTSCAWAQSPLGKEIARRMLTSERSTGPSTRGQ